MVKPRLQNGDYHIRTESGGLAIAGTQVQLVPPGGTTPLASVEVKHVVGDTYNFKIKENGKVYNLVPGKPNLNEYIVLLDENNEFAWSIQEVGNLDQLKIGIPDQNVIWYNDLHADVKSVPLMLARAVGYGYYGENWRFEPLK